MAIYFSILPAHILVRSRHSSEMIFTLYCLNNKYSNYSTTYTLTTVLHREAPLTDTMEHLPACVAYQAFTRESIVTRSQRSLVDFACPPSAHQLLPYEIEFPALSDYHHLLFPRSLTQSEWLNPSCANLLKSSSLRIPNHPDQKQLYTACPFCRQPAGFYLL